METTPHDQRRVDRRVRRVSLHYPERRSGFDRRLPRGGPIRAASARLLSSYRDRPRVVASVLGAVVLLNAVDLILTMRALDLGATELNPVMAGLLGFDPVVAAAFKMTLVGTVAIGLWVLRRYRRVLEASLLLVGTFAVLTGYHLVVGFAA